MLGDGDADGAGLHSHSGLQAVAIGLWMLLPRNRMKLKDS